MISSSKVLVWYHVLWHITCVQNFDDWGCVAASQHAEGRAVRLGVARFSWSSVAVGATGSARTRMASSDSRLTCCMHRFHFRGRSPLRVHFQRKNFRLRSEHSSAASPSSTGRLRHRDGDQTARFCDWHPRAGGMWFEPHSGATERRIRHELR